jgi:hypothetical protein
MRRWVGFLVLAVGMATALPAAAVEWKEFAKVKTVTITTKDADGSPRHTTVWMVVVDSFAYVRTGNTKWADNIERDPNVMLNVDKEDFVLRATPVHDSLLVDRIQAAYHEKYGWSDSFVHLFPSSGVKLFRLDARP